MNEERNVEKDLKANQNVVRIFFYYSLSSEQTTNKRSKANISIEYHVNCEL